MSAGSGTGTPAVAEGEEHHVPTLIKTAILQAVAHLYEHRDDADLDESAAAKTLRKFKVFRL